MSVYAKFADLQSRVRNGYGWDQVTLKPEQFLELVDALQQLEWRPIDPEMLIDKNILLGRPNGTSIMAYQGGYGMGRDAILDEWTSFLYIDPPQEKA